MPITRRQLGLGITREIERWMGNVYDFLFEHKEEAFNREEITKALGIMNDATALSRAEAAPDKLAELNVFEVRRVHKEPYYIFLREFNMDDWSPVVTARSP